MDFSNIGAKLNPFAQRIQKGFFQAKQFTQERFGTAEEVTELPAEFRELEERVDRVKLLLEGFTRITQTYTKPHHDYVVPVQDSIVDFASKVGDKISTVTEKLGTNALPGRNNKDEIPPTLPHALSKSAADGALLVGTDEPLGAALKRYSQVQEKIGNSKLVMNSEIVNKFHQPFVLILRDVVSAAERSRRDVQSARLHYDACKQRFKGSNSSHADEMRSELEKAEDEFVAAVEDAMNKMKAVIEDSGPLKHMQEICQAELNYHKAAAEALAELTPELDELVVTNEALLNRH